MALKRFVTALQAYLFPAHQKTRSEAEHSMQVFDVPTTVAERYTNPLCHSTICFDEKEREKR
jgi:hypothetical protein